MLILYDFIAVRHVTGKLVPWISRSQLEEVPLKITSFLPVDGVLKCIIKVYFHVTMVTTRIETITIY